MTDRAPVLARFRVGDPVTVLDLDKAGHVRTPAYIRGRTGRVFHFCGYFLNPEDLAVGRTDGPVYPLYRVVFPMADLWEACPADCRDTLRIEIYDHWLAPCTP